jgi:hypothetical protein
MAHRNIAALVVVLGMAFAGLAGAQEEQEPTSSGERSVAARRVFVSNFPERFKIGGEVTVKGPIPQSALVTFRDITVAPVAPKDTTRLVNAGTLVAEGFTGAVLTLIGQLKGENARPGTVGAFLVPDEEVVVRALDEQGQILLPLEVRAQTGSGSPPYFASEQHRISIAFPRYRVLLYNASDKAVTVTLFAYLVN